MKIKISILLTTFLTKANVAELQKYKHFFDFTITQQANNSKNITRAEAALDSLMDFDKDKIEDFTKDSFSELIDAQHKQGYEYLLAKVTSRNENSIEYSFFYDGNLFYKYFFGDEIILKTENQINFYALLTTYPTISLKRLNELGLPLGLQKHNYIDNFSRCPIIEIEFYSIISNKSSYCLTTLTDLLVSEKQQLHFHLFLADNYPTLAILLHVGQVLIKKKMYKNKVIQYYKKAMTLTDNEDLLKLINDVLLTLRNLKKPAQ